MLGPGIDERDVVASPRQVSTEIAADRTRPNDCQALLHAFNPMFRSACFSETGRTTPNKATIVPADLERRHTYLISANAVWNEPITSTDGSAKIASGGISASSACARETGVRRVDPCSMNVVNST